MDITINENVVSRDYDVLSQDDKNLILNDVKYEIEHHSCKDVAPYQTHANLFQRYKDKVYWNRLYLNARAMVDEKYDYYKSWANLSNEDNDYKFHKHKNKRTCIYYLKSNLPEFGTKLEGNIIIEAIENSMVSFDGMIPHSVANMPKNIAKYNPRYSVVFDFKLAF